MTQKLIPVTIISEASTAIGATWTSGAMVVSHNRNVGAWIKVVSTDLVATLSFEGSIDGTNFVTIPMWDGSTSVAIGSGETVEDIYSFVDITFSYFRFKITRTSGDGVLDALVQGYR